MPVTDTQPRHVENVGDAYRVANSRVSLDSIVIAYLSGHSAEAIAEQFPALSLAQVYGAISFYLDNRREIDAYLSQGDAEFREFQREMASENVALYRKLSGSRRSQPDRE